MKNNKRALFIAHYLQKNAVQQMPLSNKAVPANWSERLKLAWYLVHLREKLANGVITLSFWKKDHSIREAKGTLHPLLIPADKTPKGTDEMDIYNPATIPFFDLDKGEWRSFSVTHFIGFVTCYELRLRKYGG